MKEMAVFNACICQYGKRFDLFVPMVSHFSISALGGQLHFFGEKNQTSHSSRGSN
jgi:hypothetical protein